ncbi:MAG TPA: polysaccharide deacetylase family protein [Elusimicrobia bacterium]|nr:MAG: hypothetical protein A2016_12835 [Elusimicrobia bacterium GWF2_62_30]HBA60708.1 polysaccharide deacetylase family protein [Elusimicrobiota bacterium]
MTPFHYATAAAAACLAGSAFFLPGQARWWGAATALLAYGAVTAAGVFEIRLNYFCPALRHGRPGKKRIALTFDDGPDPAATPALLDLLKERGARATFFCVAERAKDNAALVRRITAEGHTLGNHSCAHRWWTNFLTGGPMKAEILGAQQVFKELCGETPRYYRSPMGLTNPHLGPVLAEAGLTLAGWDVRPFDRGTPAGTTAARVNGAARDGSIVLLHDGGAAAESLCAAVAEIISHFTALGYSFVNLDELFKDI